MIKQYAALAILVFCILFSITRCKPKEEAPAPPPARKELPVLKQNSLYLTNRKEAAPKPDYSFTNVPDPIDELEKSRTEDKRDLTD